MIVVSCPLKKDYIVELIDGYSDEGIEFKHEKTEGIKMYFSINDEERIDRGVRLVKDRIKASELGKALFFNVDKTK